ncbi:hypothetical protein GCM10010253_36910 [Streptomyces badius]|uniref:Uncharacterized protein n=1 Tax=Streptomyces badius TaxID=1941 RepID=A0ABQ2TA56_STRBA|nr:hypothetical protein GCM10010253_36910 [Streptomyces badius]
MQIADDDFGDRRVVVHDEDPAAGGRGVLHGVHCGIPLPARRGPITPIRPMSMFRKNLMPKMPELSP